MKIMSMIYHKVRHRLNDDWAFGNGKPRFGKLGSQIEAGQNNNFQRKF